LWAEEEVSSVEGVIMERRRSVRKRIEKTEKVFEKLGQERGGKVHY
jgi:hypothetical protein